MNGSYVGLRDKLVEVRDRLPAAGAASEASLTAQQPRQQYVWNTVSLAWERMTQPLIDAGTVTVAGPIEIAPPATPAANAYLPVRLTNGAAFIDAATSALQTTGNASLLSIDGKLPAQISNRVPVDVQGKTLQSAAFTLSATGTVVAAVTGKRIKVYAVKLVAGSASISVNWRDGGATALEGAQALALRRGSGFAGRTTPRSPPTSPRPQRLERRPRSSS